MDFFEHQDAARKKTWLLLLYFALAVVSMVVALYVVAVLVFALPQMKGNQSGVAVWRPEILGIVSLVVLSIIGLGSLYKIAELRGGGRRIAEMLGGRRIQPNTTDTAERRILNVVEEIALASGVPVPPVYVLEEETGINAFAAGYTPADAVIGITRGTLAYLNRDELQGVIAHEFSHILHGDMRLNIRLIGILHGILLIAIVGFYVIRVTAGTGRSRGGKRGGGGQLVLIGIAALIIGYIGLFFARLIKAAVSRQREYLADASAVQFTRNPDGIAGALKKIGGLADGSHVKSPEAESCSHMFFGSAFRRVYFSPFATHPPLADRIKRIDAQFDGKFPHTQPLQEAAARAVPPVRRAPAKLAGIPIPIPVSIPAIGAALPNIPIDPVLVIAAVGGLDEAHMAHSRGLIDSLPEALREAVHEPFSARCVIFAMLLDELGPIRDKQLEMVRKRDGEPSAQETQRLGGILQSQGHAVRMPLVEITQGTLTGMSAEQYDKFRDTVDELVRADNKLSLFEFVLQRVLIDHLDRAIRGHKPPGVSFYSPRGVTRELGQLLSCLAHVGHSDLAEAQAAYAKAMSQWPDQNVRPDLPPRSECSLKLIAESLDKLAQCSAPVKKYVLSVAAICVAADGQVTLAEAELFRAIADSLDCPLGPINVGPIAAGSMAAGPQSAGSTTVGPAT